MNDTDRRLGMNQAITRRDFLNGIAFGTGGALASRALPDALTAALRAESAMQAASIRPIGQSANYSSARISKRTHHDTRRRP
jgi:hypothetical protein